MTDRSPLEQIADTSPLLKSYFDAEVSYWHPEKAPSSALASALARRLSQCASEIPDNTMAKIFAICEAVSESGSTADREGIMTGFLEGLQHADGRREFDFNRVATHLGKASRSHCEGVDRFHGTSTRGLS